MLKIRRPLGRLIFNMGIAIPGKTVFLIETAPCLPYQDQDFAGNPNCWITGWGRLYGGGTLPSNLQELQLDVWSDSQCNDQVNNWGNWHVCVRKSGGGGCNGDSGGPLMCQVGDQWKLVGAASFVYGSCSTSHPTVYAKVSYFRDWIRSTADV